MKISAKEYANKLRVDASLVTKRLNKQKPLPMTKSVEKFGNMWIIELTSNFDAAIAADEFIIDKKKTKHYKL